MKGEIGQQAESRRELFRAGVRWSVGAGLAVLSAGLIGRDVRAPSEPPCRRPMPCSRCAARSWCGLPQAVAARNRRKG